MEVMVHLVEILPLASVAEPVAAEVVATAMVLVVAAAADPV
jgi:hypothetical protein